MAVDKLGGDLTLVEVSELLGVPKTTLRSRISKGTIDKKYGKGYWRKTKDGTILFSKKYVTLELKEMEK